MRRDCPLVCQEENVTLKTNRESNKERRNNYEYAKEKIRPEFLKYDQEAMIRRFSLKYDREFLYLPFIGTEYRVNRQSGEVERLIPTTSGKTEMLQPEPGDYMEALSIYDILCYAKPDAALSGRWCLVNSLPGVGQNNGLGDNAVTEDARYFDGNPAAYQAACRELGGKEIPCGDIGYEIPVYPFYPVRLRFYLSDEEFPAQLSVLFDENTLRYMHYETTYYVVSCLMRAIRSRMQKLPV